MCKEDVLDNLDAVVSDYLTVIDYSPTLHYLLIKGHRVLFNELYDKFGPEVIEELDNLLEGRMLTKYTKKGEVSYMALSFNALVYLAKSKGTINE